MADCTVTLPDVPAAIQTQLEQSGLTLRPQQGIPVVNLELTDSRSPRRSPIATATRSRSRYWQRFLIPGFALLCLLAPAILTAADSNTVQLSMDSPYLGQSANDDGDEILWLSVFVTVENRSDTPLQIPATGWQLRDSRNAHAPATVTDTFDWLDVVDRDETVSLTEFQPRELTVAPAAKARIGLFFQPLTTDLRQPALSLTLAVGDQRLGTLDLDQLAADQLTIEAQRIGPARAIALLRLDGELNSVNAGRLVQRIDELRNKDRVARFVIALAPELRVPDPAVLTWLRQVAAQAGLGELYNDRFAALPSGIVAVHLTEASTADELAQRPDRLLADNYENVHPRLQDAVDAAVAPLCDRLPRELLLRELREGDAVSQQAVLRHCGERLLDEDLPLILSFLESENTDLRLAAFETLRHFATQSAIAALTNAARTGDEATSREALATMATSRYGAVRSQLLTLLESSEGTLRQRVAETLGRYPHSDWAPRLFELASDSDSEIRRSALMGLVALGHPQVNRLLRDGLTSDDAALRDLSLRYLMASRDPENERLAVDAVLANLKTAPPTGTAARFLQRVRDTRAIPLLRHWLDVDTPRVRRRVVQAMLTVGDQTVLEELAARFDSLSANEQAAILSGLSEARSPQFWKLAPSALQSNRERLIDAVTELLRRDGSDRAVGLLAAAIDDETTPARRALSVCQTLAEIATPTARDVLISHAKSTQAGLRSAASAGLQQLYARSPAMPFVVRGSAFLQQQNNSALAMLHFNLAVETDPEHPPARTARADIALKDERPSQAELETAREDLRVAVRFDPSSAFALTCLGLTEVRLGAVDTGVRLVEASRERFVDDALYHYNTACIYGRAIEVLESQLQSQSPPAEETRSSIEKYRAQAVADLRQSIDKGLDEYNREWMRRDPDLKSVRQSPEFEKLFEEKIELPDLPAGLK